MSIQKILITGGSGFIGRHLIKALSELPDVELTCISRKIYKNEKNIKWINGNLRDKDLIKSLPREYFSKIFHAAWEGLPDRSFSISRANLQYSINFLNYFLLQSEVELNIIGSCLEYGNLIGGVKDEIQPQGKSDFAKAKIELNEYIKSRDVKYRWFRPFFVYGPGQNSNSLFPTLVQSVKTRTKINFQSLNNSHDFISVEDLTNGIVTASLNAHLFGEINIGSGVPNNVGDIVKGYYEKNGIIFNDKYTASPALYSENTKLKNILQWKPKITRNQEIIDYLMKLSNNL